MIDPLVLLGLTVLFVSGIMLSVIIHPGWIILTAIAVLLTWVQ